MANKLHRVRLYIESIRHTKPRQLYYRLFLLVKRKLLRRFASPEYAASVAVSPIANIERSPIPPQPMFGARSHLIEDGTPPVVNINNVREPLTLPMSWRPAKHQVGTRLWLLNLHYMEFLEALPDAVCWRYVLDWIEQNQPYEGNYWLENWNSFCLSIRVVVWMQQLTTRPRGPTCEEEAQIRRSIHAQLQFLMRNLERDIEGNHLVKNAKALLWGSAWFQHPDTRKWRATGERLVGEILDSQILADGMHYELSPAYHCQVFVDLMECWQALEAGPLRSRLEVALGKMAQTVADFTHPDGRISLFNDAGLHMAYEPAECLSVHERLLGSSLKPSTDISYAEAGYYGRRCQKHYVLVDCAEMAPDSLPAHGHGDALSFEWSILDQRTIIDPGVFEYDSGARRNFSRATSSHNTVTLDNQDQTEFWMSFRAGRRARITTCRADFSNSVFELLGAHDGYARLDGKPVHLRRFVVDESGIDIYDEIQGGASQHVVARLMLHPDSVVDQIDAARLVCKTNNARFEVRASSPISVVDSTCFLDFGHELPTKQLEIDIGCAPCAAHIELRIL